MIRAGTGAGRAPDPASATSPSSPQTKLPFCRSDGPSAWVSNTGSLAHGRRRLRTYMPISEAPAAELPSAPLKYSALSFFSIYPQIHPQVLGANEKAVRIAPDGLCLNP